MREPKFRGFSNETKNWHYGYGWFEIDYTEDYLLEKGIEKQAMLYTDGHPIVCEMKSMGEYTGLKDKHGKEIFEGDIVSGWKDSHWHDGKDRVLKEVEWTDELAGFNIIQIEMRTCEVIGNIYENPELLGGQHD